MRLLVLTLLSIALDAYNIPPTGVKRTSEVDAMITQCFQTLCKDWMAECHWYCDAVKGPSFMRRCKDCLSWRGANCMDCFEINWGTERDGFAESFQNNENMSQHFVRRKLQETCDGGYSVVIPVRPFPFTSTITPTYVVTKPQLVQPFRPRSIQQRNAQRCLEQKVSNDPRPVLEQALIAELQPQKQKIEQGIEQRRIARLQSLHALPVLQSKPTRSSSPVAGQKTVVQELRQRLNGISVNSKFDIDRIVKENKTTTITESRETIHFRPEEEKLIKVAHPDAPTASRLSVQVYPHHPKAQSDPSHAYFNIIKSNKSEPKKLSIDADNKDTLLGEYVRLEEDIKDINRKNNELKEKFMQKNETTILIPSKKSSPTTSFIPAEPSARLLTAQPRSSETETKTTGYRHETLDYRTVKISKPRPLNRLTPRSEFY